MVVGAIRKKYRPLTGLHITSYPFCGESLPGPVEGIKGTVDLQRPLG